MVQLLAYDSIWVSACAQAVCLASCQCETDLKDWQLLELTSFRLQASLCLTGALTASLCARRCWLSRHVWKGRGGGGCHPTMLLSFSSRQSNALQDAKCTMLGAGMSGYLSPRLATSFHTEAEARSQEDEARLAHLLLTLSNPGHRVRASSQVPEASSTESGSNHPFSQLGG